MGRPVATSVRTLLVSDIHLGCKHSQAGACLKFIQAYQPEQVFLVGDIIDGWKYNKGWHWPEECSRVLDHLEMWIAQGVQIFYVPGNHDSFLRNRQSLRYMPEIFNRIKIENEFVFETIGGWRFLVTHGDLFDWFEMRAQWVSKGTSWIYDSILTSNRRLNRWFGRHHANPYGACAVMKDRVKRGVRFISRFESKIMQHARQKSCEGVICGHIHTPDIVRDDTMLYCNTGDWVENCTGLIEHHDGTIKLESTYGQPKLLKLATHQRRRSEKDLGEETYPIRQPASVPERVAV